MIVTLDKVFSQLPAAKTVFQALTPEDWKPIDQRYANMAVERVVANMREAKHKKTAKSN